MSKRRKFINIDPVEGYATVGRLGIGDPVVLVCDDIEVTAANKPQVVVATLGQSTSEALQ